MKTRKRQNLKSRLAFLTIEERRITAKLRNCRKKSLYAGYLKSFVKTCGTYVKQDISTLQRLNGGKINTILCAGILARQYGLTLRNVCDALALMELARKDLYSSQTEISTISFVYAQVDVLVRHLETGGRRCG